VVKHLFEEKGGESKSKKEKRKSHDDVMMMS